MDVVFVNDFLKKAYIISTNLMAETARSAMNLNNNSAWGQPHALSGRFVKHLVYHVHFDEMITGYLPDPEGRDYSIRHYKTLASGLAAVWATEIPVPGYSMP